ncbi:hypothetical protein K438DRAFT_459329 [Mycena galopus ATCC 62051]|nr:hypothetical protein K438DRAFT_459329 [Mycena galopus ATCC 62051]
MAAQMALLLSDDFAVVLGLKSSIYPDRNLREGRELERHQRLLGYLRRNALETQMQQDVIWSRFCAVYLLATIDRLLNLPTPTDSTTTSDQQGMLLDFSAHNPWHEMLVAVQHIPYFAKYLRSRNPIAAAGKKLPQILAGRLFDVSARWEKKMTAPARTTNGEAQRQYYIAAAGNAVQLLSTLCTHFVNKTGSDAVISHETQQKLLPILTVWHRRYNRQFLGSICRRMLDYMAESKNSSSTESASCTRTGTCAGSPLATSERISSMRQMSNRSILLA